MPRVTIVAPTYNAARFVRQCVDSALAQTFRDFELVVVDDGSTDGTADVVESYRDPRVRCLRLPHRGLRALAESYNAALAESHGELVAILEGDDFWPPDKLEVQVRGFDDPAVQLSWGAGLEVDEEGRTLRVCRGVALDGGTDRVPTATLFRELVRAYVLYPSVTVMMRRAALDRIGGFRQDGSANYVDLPTCMLLLARSQGVALHHHHVLGCWRRHGAQATSMRGDTLLREHRRVVRDVVAALEPEERAGVGWSGALARANQGRWRMAAARAALRGGRFSRARRLSLAVVRDGPGMALRAKAMTALASAVAGVDLSTAWRRMRGRA
ncbi:MULTISPECIES: glycosyltransferase family 2 protein [Anaeromyxobacter]|uniref:glycosyltransferase family 2 protein n=1 Tax=Anaeromyxobacter TaxID=161492 RepID=UPI001F5910DC|nr:MULTISPECIES: glycosyltransferase family 2 protein [unclassified Anaeromyxobacter]